MSEQRVPGPDSLPFSTEDGPRSDGWARADSDTTRAQRLAASVALGCARQIAEAARHGDIEADAVVLSASAFAELRVCIHDYSDRLRSLDTPPETALLLVKRIVAEAMDEHGVRSESFMRAAVGWMIEGYYRLPKTSVTQ